VKAWVDPRSSALIRGFSRFFSAYSVPLCFKVLIFDLGDSGDP